VIRSPEVVPKPDRQPKPKPKAAQGPRPAQLRDKPVKGWSRSKIGQAGRGRSGK
jgi:hypothetical protein